MYHTDYGNSIREDGIQTIRHNYLHAVSLGKAILKAESIRMATLASYVRSEIYAGNQGNVAIGATLASAYKDLYLFAV